MNSLIPINGLPGLLVALILTSGFVKTSVAAVEPNLYELTGKDVQITYSTSGLSGEARLHYRTRRIDRTFTGDEIRVTPAEIGELVTVTILQVPDLKTVTATVLIPDINLGDEPLSFKTYLIRTTHRTTIAGPELVKGQIQSYSTRALKGKASHVDYIHSNLSGEVSLSPTCPGPVSPGQDCVAPFSGALVRVLDSAMNIAATAVTDESGMFEVHVTPGKYIVRASALQIDPYPLPLPQPQPLPEPDAPGSVNLAPASSDPDIISVPLYPVCPDTPATVPERGSVFVSIDCDTGIR